MSKIILMRGLPASGKSTKAKALLEHGNTVRLNKDLLRTMLHFDKFTNFNEKLTGEAEIKLGEYFLSTGTNIIVDDTNLNPKTVQKWVDIAKKLNATIQYEDLTDVSIEVCLERDWGRDKFVGESVIKKMALQYLDYLKGERILICDLDGTLCDINHRLHFVKQEPKDWKSFFEGISGDHVNHDVLDQLKKHYKEGGKIILVSARPEEYRAQTEVWLNKAFKGIPLHSVLIMRDKGDKRPDTMVKEDVYNKYLKDLTVEKVLDDRPSVIRMWRSKGLHVEDCGDGIEF